MYPNYRIFFITICIATSLLNLKAQEKPWSVQMSETAMSLWPAGVPANWNYEQGVVMTAIGKVYDHTYESRYLQYIQGKVDYFVGNSGRISTYFQGEYNLDHIASGRALLFLHQKTYINKYKLAAEHLRGQLLNHPRTPSKGFWHKNIYPNQMWLDGLYMAEPFYSAYSKLYNEANFDDIAHQFLLMHRKAFDPQTGLLYHAWDESKQQAWANPTTGCSPNFWGRAMGWYAMALIDVLDELPQSHPKRDSLISIFRNLSQAIVQVQDDQGLWWQVLDQKEAAGNYRESSASCMFVYALAKGVRQRYLESNYWQYALQGYQGILGYFTYKDQTGRVHLTGTCAATGLGGSPYYRDGSYTYYIGVPQVQDDARGVGPFIMASLEIEQGEIVANAQDRVYDLGVYPNPITDFLQLPVQNSNTFCIIRNTLGQILYSGKAEVLIDAQLWPAGYYIVEISDETQKIRRLKMMKR